MRIMSLRWRSRESFRGSHQFKKKGEQQCSPFYLASSTRSVGTSLARRFNAGIRSVNDSRRVATVEQFQTSPRDALYLSTLPGL